MTSCGKPELRFKSRHHLPTSERLFVKKGGRTRPGEESLPTKMRSVRAQQGAYRRDSRIRSI